WRPIHLHVLLDEVPAARTHEQSRDLLVEPVLLAIWIRETDLAADSVIQVDLPLHAVLPGGRVGVLKVGHEDPRARVERVNDHLAIYRAGDLHATVLQIGWDRRDSPCVLADLASLRQEVVARASVERNLPVYAPLEQLHTSRVEFAVQRRK